MTTNPPAGPSSWSADGSWLAFDARFFGAVQAPLWRVSIDGKTVEPLTQGPGRAPRFSPDGDMVVFIGSGERAGNVWVLSLKDGEERPLTNLASRRGSPAPNALATDGDYVYFAWQEDLGDIWVMDVVTDESE